jgi:hypothetical protein
MDPNQILEHPLTDPYPGKYKDPYGSRSGSASLLKKHNIVKPAACD